MMSSATRGVRRILVPVDFSECSFEALDYASWLAQSLGAAVDVLHVRDPHSWEDSDPVSGASADVEPDPTLQDALFRLERDGVPGRALSETGPPDKAIVRVACSGAYDLIVMGTHGRTGLSHVLLGSIAEEVMRRAPCPLVTIRATTRRAVAATHTT
jgi:nucleotide-binding universal stress UspA family protein